MGTGRLAIGGTRTGRCAKDGTQTTRGFLPIWSGRLTIQGYGDIHSGSIGRSNEGHSVSERNRSVGLVDRLSLSGFNTTCGDKLVDGDGGPRSERWILDKARWEWRVHKWNEAAQA